MLSPTGPTRSIRLPHPTRVLAVINRDNAHPVAVLPPDICGHWGSRCERHQHTEAWDTITIALIAMQSPVDWCPQCEREAQREVGKAAAQ